MKYTRQNIISIATNFYRDLYSSTLDTGDASKIERNLTNYSDDVSPRKYEIRNEFLKLGKDQLVVHLQKLFKKILEIKYMLQLLKKAKIFLFHKKSKKQI